MPLRDIDRQLIDRCLKKEPGAWNDFVDRYMGLIYHVIDHVANARSMTLSAADVEDIAAEIFLGIVDDDYGVLRRFQGGSSLPTYLTVVARRICVRHVVKRQREAELGHTSAHRANVSDDGSGEAEAIAVAEEVERMLETYRLAQRPSASGSITSHELPRDRQAPRHPRKLRRPHPRQGPPASPTRRRATQPGRKNPPDLVDARDDKALTRYSLPHHLERDVQHDEYNEFNEQQSLRPRGREVEVVSLVAQPTEALESPESFDRDDVVGREFVQRIVEVTPIVRLLEDGLFQVQPGLEDRGPGRDRRDE